MDIACAGGSQGFRAIRANVSADPTSFFQLGHTRPGPACRKTERASPLPQGTRWGTNTDANSEIFFTTAEVDSGYEHLSGRYFESGKRKFPTSISDDGRFIAFFQTATQQLKRRRQPRDFVYDSVALSFSQIKTQRG